MAFNPKISIVDYLTSIGEDNSFSARKKIAEDLGIENYRGTAEQNKQMLEGYQKSNESLGESEKDVQEALSKNDTKALRQAIEKHGQDKVAKYLREQGIYDKTVARLRESNRQEDLRDGKLDTGLTDRSETDKLLDENKPTSTTFEQYKEREFTDEEKKAFQEEAKTFVDPLFKQIGERATADYKTQIRDVNRLIQYSKTDLALDLAKTNKTFANTMSRATQAYGRRNILGSGIMKQQAGEQVDELQKSVTNREEYQRRQEEAQLGKKENIQTKFNRFQADTAQDQTFYTDLYAKQLQEGIAKNTLKDFAEASKRLKFGNNTEADTLDFSTTTNTTNKKKPYTGTDVNNKTNTF